MRIERISKTIYKINNMRINTRKQINNNYKRIGGVRKALMIYFSLRNPKLAPVKIDIRICKWINSNLPLIKVLESQTIIK